MAKDGEPTRRFALHTKLGDIENDKNSGRDGKRVKRGDGDQDTEGWSTVKPRKSFGDGAERMFIGRMGGERHKDERRTRDSHDKEHKDRPARGFENYSREKEADHDHEDTPRKERNGVGRGRNEPTWFKDNKDEPPSTTGRNGNKHVDSNRGWREKERDDVDKGGERGDRRWNRDKDQRQERDPEWMAEADDEKKQTPHTMEDFEKWKKLMKASNGDTPAADDGPSKDTQAEPNGFEPGSFFGPEAPKVDTPLGIETGPDKFFGQWAGDKKEKSLGDLQQDEGLPTPKAVGKSSRFKSFFAAPPSEEPLRRVTEPTPTKQSAPKGDLGALFGNKTESSSEDKEAFAALLQKLHSQSIAPPHSTPPINTNPPPPQLNHEARPQSAAQQMPESFAPYRQDRQEEQRHSSRNSQQHLIDLLNQKQPMHNQQPNHTLVPRPEQMVQEIMNQRQGAPSHTAGRSEQARDPNSDFMLSLMQNTRAPPPQQQQQQPMLSRRESQTQNAERLRQLEHDTQLAREQQQYELERQREQRELRDRRLLQAQRQARKQQELPQGYFDEQMMPGNFPPQSMEQQRNVRPQQQPTQILQRPPPGLDNGMPPPNLSNWGGPSNQQQPPPHAVQPRHIQPPPGLPGGVNGMLPINMQQNMQNLNLNQNMGIAPPLNSGGFPPGFMPGGFEGVMQRPGMPVGLPPPPPPGFFPPPPPGFIQQQQQGRGGMGGGMVHGGYDGGVGGVGGQGVAFLQGQMFDGRTGQGPQGQPFRR